MRDIIDAEQNFHDLCPFCKESCVPFWTLCVCDKRSAEASRKKNLDEALEFVRGDFKGFKNKKQVVKAKFK